MGMKTTNYEIKRTGITVPTAYAQIASAVVNRDSSADYTVVVQTTRDNIGKLQMLETHRFQTVVDKHAPLHEQLYTHLKAQDKFKDWEDDIVE